MQLPASSLIICSRDRERLLVETVRSILHGHELPSELLIIDQSRRASAELAGMKMQPGCDIRYVWSKQHGVSRGRNLGMALARHEVLIFTDDDMAAPAGWFGTLLRALVAAGPGHVVTGRVISAPSDDPAAFAPSISRDDQPAVYQGRIARDVLYSGNMAVYRSVLRETGGFDPQLGPGTAFPAAEDNDLGFRLLERGYKILFAPEAVILHRAWRKRTEYLAQCWRYELGQGAFYAKHASLTDTFMLKRMFGQVRRQALRKRRMRGREWRQSCVDAVCIAGVLWGALTWKVAHLLRRGRPRADVAASIDGDGASASGA